MTVLLSECLSDREPSLYFVQNMLSKVIKTGNHKKMIVKWAIKMVIVIVKNTRLYYRIIKAAQGRMSSWKNSRAKMCFSRKKKQRNAADLLVECLQEEGVEYIFGIPGEENLAVMNAIDRSPIKFITTRHEQGAAFMADVYGRLTGKAGVCLATLGPGATNLVTGVADADSDGAPLVAITGQVGTERMHITGHQFLDLTKMFEPITKRTKMVVRPDTVGEIVRLAFKYAESEKPGATHIDMPVNVAKMPVSEGEKPLRKKIAPKEYAELDTVQDAAGMIFQAKNPVILAGSGVVRGHAAKELTEFATKLKIPVINTMMAKGVIPFDNPYSMWTIGIPQKDYQNKIMEEADLVIAVGYDIVEYAPAKWNPEGKIDIVHVDMRPAHINKLYQPEVEVVGTLPMPWYRSEEEPPDARSRSGPWKLRK